MDTPRASVIARHSHIVVKERIPPFYADHFYTSKFKSRLTGCQTTSSHFALFRSQSLGILICYCAEVSVGGWNAKFKRPNRQ